MRGVGSGAGGNAGGRRRRRIGPATVLSLLAHVGVLAWLGLGASPELGNTLASPPDFEVVLERPSASAGAAALPQSRREAVRETSPGAPARAAPTTTTAPAPAMAVAPPPRTTPAPPPPTGSAGPAAGVQGTEAPAGAAAGVGPAAGDLRGLLREALGCAHAQMMDLSPTERARCAERLGLASRTAPRFDPIPAEKRAYYDAVAKAYAEGRAPPGGVPTGFAGAPRTGVLADKGGLYIPLPVCAMRFGAPRGWKSYHDVPPHSLRLGKLGPLPCFIAPPSGRGFEESGVETPASLRERTDDAAHMKALDPPKP